MNNDLLNQKIDKVEALKQRNRDRLAKSKAKEKKLNDRYKFIIGEIMISELPNILVFNTTQTEKEREIIISEFKAIISKLSSYYELILENNIRAKNFEDYVIVPYYRSIRT